MADTKLHRVLTNCILTVMALVAMTLSACSPASEEDALAGADAGKVNVQIVLTRNASGQALGDEAQGNEAYIHPYDVRLLAYNPQTGDFVSEAVVHQVLPTADPDTYSLLGSFYEIDKELLGNSMKFVVMANLNGFCRVEAPASFLGFTQADACDNVRVRYDYAAATNLSALMLQGDRLTDSPTVKARIPMWGCTVASFQDNQRINMGMLRALARVDVKLSEDLAQKYDIYSIHLANANTEAMLAPVYAYMFYDTPSNEQLDLPHVGAGTTQHTNEVPFYCSDPSKGVFTVYMPEQEAPKASDLIAPGHMKVTLRTKAVNSPFMRYNLYFSSVQGNKATVVANGFPVLRNNHYTFTIEAIEKEHVVTYAAVCQWNYREGDIIFN